MAGISDRSARDIARLMGCDLVFTEMASAEGLRRADRKTFALLDMEGEAPPVSVQVFGREPAAFAEAARILQDRGAHAIDINAGCPARKVIHSGCGVALLQDLPRLAAILRETRRAISLPLTLKYRAGWDTDCLVHLEVARMAQSEGVDALTLHPRTGSQGFSGHANWALIGEAKQSIAIPVIGNGDISSGADARRMVAQTGCDAVMIGRCYMGNPWVLRAAIKALTTNASDAECDRPVALDERLGLMMSHARSMAARKGERRGVIEMRKFAAGYLKGVSNSKPLRMALMRCESLAAMEEALAMPFRGEGRL